MIKTFDEIKNCPGEYEYIDGGLRQTMHRLRVLNGKAHWLDRKVAGDGTVTWSQCSDVATPSTSCNFELIGHAHNHKALLLLEKVRS